MDAGQVKTFVDAASQLLPKLVEYAALDADKRNPEHDALMRQLRVAAGAIGMALQEVARMAPPPQYVPLQPLPGNTSVNSPGGSAVPPKTS